MKLPNKDCRDDQAWDQALELGLRNYTWKAGPAKKAEKEKWSKRETRSVCCQQRLTVQIISGRMAKWTMSNTTGKWKWGRRTDWFLGLPCWSSGEDSVLPMQKVWVQSIPGWQTKIPHAMRHSQKKRKKDLATWTWFMSHRFNGVMKTWRQVLLEQIQKNRRWECGEGRWRQLFWDVLP